MKKFHHTLLPIGCLMAAMCLVGCSVSTETTHTETSQEATTESDSDYVDSGYIAEIKNDRSIPFDSQEVTIAPSLYDDEKNRITDTSDYSFQWYEYNEESDDYTEIEGETGESFTFKATPDTVGYMVNVKGPDGIKLKAYYTPENSNNTFIVYIDDNPYIEVNDEDVTITASIYDAKGHQITDLSDYTFQWANGFDEEMEDFNEIENATDVTYTFNANRKDIDAYEYFAVLATNTKTGCSNSIAYMPLDKECFMDIKVDGEKYIDLDGKDITIEALLYDADDKQIEASDELQYQWYVADENAEDGFREISGETSPTFTFKAEEENLKEYRIIVTKNGSPFYGYFEPIANTDNQARVEEAIEAIAVLGTEVSLRDEEYITEAKTLYDALTEEQKAMVPDYYQDMLNDAIEKFEAL